MKKFKEIEDGNDAKMPLTLKNYLLILAGPAGHHPGIHPHGRRRQRFAR